jgi:hypothetical protein
MSYGKIGWKGRRHHWRHSGTGLATANTFVDEGAYVFITGRRAIANIVS